MQAEQDALILCSSTKSPSYRPDISEHMKALQHFAGRKGVGSVYEEVVSKVGIRHQRRSSEGNIREVSR